MAEKLTAQQKQAVSDRGGRLLVSAAAGSGKTKVLVDRLLGYLKDPVNPANLDDFLIITYTKAAAAELRGKIAAKLAEVIAQEPQNRHLQRQMQRLFLTKISTVHGFCGDILREYAYRLDLSADFRVADENECREIRETVLAEVLDRAYEKAGEDPDFRAFVDTQGLGRDDRLVAEIVLKVYDSARCHLDSEGWLQACLDHGNVEGLTDASQTIWGRSLMEDLFSYLDCQIHVMEKCAQLAESSDGMAKAAVNLRDTLYQLRQLRGCETWDQIVAAKGIDYGRLTFPRKGIDDNLADQIRACRKACKTGLDKKLRSFSDTSEQVLEDLGRSAGAACGLIELVRQFSVEYDKAKHSRRVLDFGDLEHKMLDLVLGTRRSGITALANEIGDRYREIMVDEYQDSNGVQDAIFMALTSKRQNCFMVGDVKQSIYQFRLADPDIFLEKYHEYAPAKEAEAGQGRKVLLSANFRSGREIVDAVNDVFMDCMSPAVGGLHYGPDEMLREGIPHKKLPEPAVELYGLEINEDAYGEEAAFVADRIAEMLRNGCTVRDGEILRPVRESDIVILLRSPGSVGARFHQALENRGIRCSSGGGVDLLQTQEISFLRSLLQTIANPRQDIPLISTLASPVFGFTADDLAAIRSRRKHGCFYDALLLSDMDKVKQFLGMLEILRWEARMHPIAHLLEKIFSMTRMDSIFAAMNSGAVRKSNLQTFYHYAADYESTGRRELSQFLEHLDAMEEKGLQTASEGVSDSVTIMSIHKSKGLEFPVVFLAGLSRAFNRENLRAAVLCDKSLGLGLSVADTDNRLRYPAISKKAIMGKAAAESLSEEMRVLYVAMTRARDRLIMTYSASNLAAELSDIALRYDISGGELLTRDVVCPGEWVLLSAMLRTEAGAFHNLGGRPRQLRISENPWKICVAAGAVKDGAGGQLSEEEFCLPANTVEVLADALKFRYAHIAASRTPSKQTATSRKGRVKDQEAAENTDQTKLIARNWRKPAFLGSETGGTAYGSAIHSVLQYISYEKCLTLEGIRGEICRLADQHFITSEQAQMADAAVLLRFFRSEIGRKLCSGTSYIREFKFSILDDGEEYGEGLAGERVLLQGVVDCALLEEDGITILDFKTDYVTEDTILATAEQYSLQVRTYAHALERIYQKPVRKAYLYFFRLDSFVEV